MRSESLFIFARRTVLFAIMSTAFLSLVARANQPESLAVMKLYSRVTGIAAGDTASVQTWDFSSANIVEGDLALKRRAVNDSVFIDSWLGMNYTRVKRGDLVFLIARNNRLVSAQDTLGAIETIAPVTAGNHAACEYGFSGNYSKELQMMEKGHSQTTFDSMGTLILPNDTIDGVKRIRTDKIYKVIVDDSVSGEIFESIQMTLPEVSETTFRWLMPDDDFPLAVITEYAVTSNGEIIDQGQTAYIADVPKRDNHTPKRATLPSAVAVKKVEVGKGYLIAHYSVGNAPSDIHFVLTDNSGRVCTMKKLTDAPVGEDKVTIYTGSIPPGYYLFAASATGEYEANKRVIIIP